MLELGHGLLKLPGVGRLGLLPLPGRGRVARGGGTFGGELGGEQVGQDHGAGEVGDLLIAHPPAGRRPPGDRRGLPAVRPGAGTPGVAAGAVIPCAAIPGTSTSRAVVPPAVIPCAAIPGTCTSRAVTPPGVIPVGPRLAGWPLPVRGRRRLRMPAA